LALAVHAAFFALLYLGVNWHIEPPQGMVVEMWESLPEPKVVPARIAPPPVEQPEPAMPVVPPKLVEPERPVLPPKADIQLREMKKPKVKPVEVKKPPPPTKKPVEIKKPVPQKIPEVPKVDLKALAEQQALAEQRVQAELKARAEQNAQAELARTRAAQAGALGKLMDEYIGKIRGKIRSNIVMPLNVPDNAEAKFDVTLLPGGEVLNVKLVKPSGNAAWDSAVERGILKAHILPLPPDVALFNKFRELHLTFKPEK
jgi:colicin import membrane protein